MSTDTILCASKGSQNSQPASEKPFYFSANIKIRTSAQRCIARRRHIDTHELCEYRCKSARHKKVAVAVNRRCTGRTTMTSATSKLMPQQNIVPNGMSVSEWCFWMEFIEPRTTSIDGGYCIVCYHLRALYILYTCIAQFRWPLLGLGDAETCCDIMCADRSCVVLCLTLGPATYTWRSSPYYTRFYLTDIIKRLAAEPEPAYWHTPTPAVVIMYKTAICISSWNRWSNEKARARSFTNRSTFLFVSFGFFLFFHIMQKVLWFLFNHSFLFIRTFLILFFFHFFSVEKIIHLLFLLFILQRTAL